MRETITLPNELERLSELVAFASNFAAHHRLPDAELHRLLVILDELFSNIVRHGYSAAQHGTVELSLSYARDRLCVVVTDDGRPFDPLAMTGPDLDLPPSQRQPGGLGIHFVRRLVDRARYSRCGDRNRIVLTRRSSPSVLPRANEH